MPYEATVPVHRRLLWPAVTDVERLIGALPNASIDASGAQGVAGRLRVRTRDQTVTFRGVARIVKVVPASLRVSLEVEAVFGRAGGTVEGIVEIALRQAGSGTRVVVDGRLDINPGAAALSAEALDNAFHRVVRRWFAALAETSPAKAAAADKPSPAERSEPADESGRRPADERPLEELPRRRAAERAPLAVVRDLAVDEERPDEERPDQERADGSGGEREQARDEDSGNGVTAPVELPQHAESQPKPPGSQASNASNVSNGPTETTQHGCEHDDADAESPGAESPAPVPLRLVTPTPQAADEMSGAQAADPEEPEAAPSPEHASEVAEAEPEDIWSRLRDRSVPPWIPFLVGVATASFAGLAVVLAALRRRYRR